jgi:hypothetical protein
MRALRPGLATIPGAMLLIASSPYAKRGELYNAFRKHFGKDDAKVLVWKAATLAMHPTLELMRHDASCGVNGKRRTPNRSDCAPYDFRVSPRQRPVRVELTRSPNRRSMTAICELCSLMGQGGSSSGVGAFGCLRSLRARSALDGVSWVQRGSVEIAVGQRLAPATQSTPSSPPSLGRRSAWELDSASCLVACRLRRTRTPSRLETSHA